MVITLRLTAEAPQWKQQKDPYDVWQIANFYEWKLIVTTLEWDVLVCSRIHLLQPV
jgi:hypothetical protein